MANSTKNKLQAELSKGDPDISIVAALTDQLLDENTEAIRFSVDAQHIQRLGFELVGKQETALSELIKNAYDADATEVRILFENHQEAGGKLIISDDGLGMSATTIKQTWMRISTDDKLKTPVSELYKRKKAGKKGIGRFAVQRLGKCLILETELEGQTTGLRVHFKWDSEFTSGRDLNRVWNKIETYNKNKDAHGTKLIIDDLRDKWTEKTIERVWKSVLLLQPPYKLSKVKSNELDPGFSVVINGISNERQEKEVSIQKSFLDHAIAIISGYIDANGEATYRVQSRKLNLDDKHISERKFLLSGPVSLETRYFIFTTEMMAGISSRAASEMGNRYGGLRIYRDGFRVLPYGEPHDDWLQLARDTGRRTLLVPANNSNFFGQVEITKEDNLLLEETSGREGLIENEAYEELQKFTRQCVEWAALRIASIRERKQTASQKGFTSTVRKPSEVIEDIISDFEDEFECSSVDNESTDKTKKAFEDIRTATKAYEELQDRSTEERIRYDAMLRILASLGLSISVFGHEVKGISNSVKMALAIFKKALEDNEESPNKIVLMKKAEAIDESVSKVFDLGRYIANLMSNTETRELKSISVRGVIEDFTDQFSDYMRKQNINFSVVVDPPGTRTCKMHRSELDSVLFNFLTNSIKALRKAKQNDRRIRVSASIEDTYINIFFEDNGCGVSEEYQDRIFDPFFTTAEIDTEDEITGTGTGLGLKIVSDIATSYGGDVSLAKPSKGYNTCFRFRVLKDLDRQG